MFHDSTAQLIKGAGAVGPAFADTLLTETSGSAVTIVDRHGMNAGLFELASGPEVSRYFDTVMRQNLLPSDRVRHLPMTDHLGDGKHRLLLTGEMCRRCEDEDRRRELLRHHRPVDPQAEIHRWRRRAPRGGQRASASVSAIEAPPPLYVTSAGACSVCNYLLPESSARAILLTLRCTIFTSALRLMPATS